MLAAAAAAAQPIRPARQTSMQQHYRYILWDPILLKSLTAIWPLVRDDLE